jgi:hypothetical protein
MAGDDTDRRRAAKRAREKVKFIRHLIVYLSVLAILALINNVTGNEEQWWLWVAFGWGIAVFFHFMGAFVFRGGGLLNLEERFTEKELERIRKKKGE